MGRRSYYDTDEERLPEGMQRIGYDADTETYTFRDADGSIWESAPGSRYGGLHKVSNGSPPRRNDDDNDGDSPEDSADHPFLPPNHHYQNQKTSWRHELMPLLNFFLLIGLVLLGLFWFLGWAAKGKTASSAGGAVITKPVVVCGEGTAPYEIVDGDTCWAVAEQKGVGLEALMAANEGLVCEKLEIGQTICAPA